MTPAVEQALHSLRAVAAESEGDRAKLLRAIASTLESALAAPAGEPAAIHEDELPPMTDRAYAAWFDQSWIPNGVGCRVGPPIAAWIRPLLTDALAAPAGEPAIDELVAEYERGRKAGITQVYDSMLNAASTPAPDAPSADTLNRITAGIEHYARHHPQADTEALAALESLRAFAHAIMTDWPDVGGLDGADLQELGIKHGLLELKMPKPTEPCGENCNCASYFADDEWAEGIECYRLSALVKMPAAPAGEPVAWISPHELAELMADKERGTAPITAYRVEHEENIPLYLAAPAGEPAGQITGDGTGEALPPIIEEEGLNPPIRTCEAKPLKAANLSAALRAIVRECRDDKPFSSDSYLPPHLLALAVAALESTETQEHETPLQVIESVLRGDIERAPSYEELRELNREKRL